MNIEVIHRDAHLLVVCKPSGLPTTSPSGTGCLVELVKGIDPDAPRLHASSRLDAEVTGLVTFARTREATHALIDARERGLYVRRYVALVEHAPEPLDGSWSWSIGIDPNERRSRIALEPGPVAAGDPGDSGDPGEPGEPGEKAGPDGRAQAALTRYATRWCGDRLAVLDLWPQTGRTHQLRVHAQRAGVPLLGDRHYGGKRRVVGPDGRVTRAGRVMLHCAELRIPDPAANRAGATLELRAPVPDDMRALCAALAPDAPENMGDGLTG